jgi:hypothetical protein
MFYLDLCASSMRETCVKERIEVSPAAIGNFTSTPKTLGAWPLQSMAEYPSTFDQVRSELGERLTAATRDEPARISTDELQKVKEDFLCFKSSLRLLEEQSQGAAHPKRSARPQVRLTPQEEATHQPTQTDQGQYGGQDSEDGRAVDPALMAALQQQMLGGQVLVFFGYPLFPFAVRFLVSN